MSRERQYLLDVLLAAEEALVFVGGADQNILATDPLVRAGVLHHLTLIGEASNRLLKSADPEQLPDLPWRKMADLRNVIVHEYEGVDLSRIWVILQQHLPIVVDALDPLFPDRQKP
jgi:uncharacterized protein with HEPN domain